MDIILRSEAISQGLTYYFTGEACKRGHISRRLTKSSYCYECWRLVKTSWLQRTGKAKEYAAQYRNKQDPDERRAQGAAYKRDSRRRNPEKHKEASRRYYEKNLDTILVYNASKRISVRERTPPWIDRKLRRQMMDYWREAKRLTESTGVVHEVDHEIPLLGENVSGLNVPWNLRIITRSENRRKHSKTPPLPVVVDSRGKLRCPDFYAQKAAPKQWMRQLTATQKDEYAAYVFREMRRHGFPLPPPPTAGDLRKCVDMARRALDTENEFMKSRVGIDIANSYFPHMYSIRGNKLGAPIDVFNDDGWLLSAIKTRIEIGNHMSPKGMRTMLSATAGARAVTNFRPIVAATLAARFAGENARVLDPCAGWGGRLLGAAVAPNVSSYVGFEPATDTHAALQRLIVDVAPWVHGCVHPLPFEDSVLDRGFDFAITSPPYFDLEHYSSEPSQSYIRWPSQAAWRDGFLRPLVQKTFDALRPGAVFVLNVANSPSYRMLEVDAVHDALSVGFILEDTMQYLLAQRVRGTSGRYEPLFVFRKPSKP